MLYLFEQILSTVIHLVKKTEQSVSETATVKGIGEIRRKDGFVSPNSVLI